MKSMVSQCTTSLGQLMMITGAWKHLKLTFKAVNKEPITIIKPKLNNRLKAIELILKHTDVKGLDHGVEVNMTAAGIRDNHSINQG